MSDSPPQHQNYPLHMRHPNYRPAVKGVSADDRKNPPQPAQAGSPAYMPPVNAENAQQEEYFASRGYRPAGTSDAKAYQTMLAAPPPVPGDFSEYPKWVGGKAVRNAEEEAAARQRMAQAEAEAAAAAQHRANDAETLDLDGTTAGELQDQINELRQGQSTVMDSLIAITRMLQAGQQPAQPAATPAALPTDPAALRALYDARAKELGIEPDGRWSLDRLVREIAAIEQGPRSE